MLKSVEDASRFKIFHVQPDVEKILKMTGFDRLLSMPHKNHTANETII
jgi:anti-anti-sigma regulatory factor